MSAINKRHGMNGEARTHRQHIASHSQYERNGECADHHAERNSQYGHSADLKQIDARDIEGCRAQYLQRRDAPAPQREIRCNAVVHAYSRHRERRQPDKREKLSHAPQEAAGAGRRILPVVDVPP